MDFLLLDFMGKPAWIWLAFLAIVAALLAFDLGVLNRKDHEIGVRESLGLSALYITLGLAYGGWVWWYLGQAAGLDYLTGFVVEKSLAMDNVFVIAMIFTFFAVPREYQHRVLFWGVIGVIVLRAIMIALGAALVEQAGWVLYLFAGFLIFTGIKMWAVGDKPYDIGNSAALRFVKRRMPVTDTIDGHDFFTQRADPATGETGWVATPLFLALVMIEVADVVFAFDSVPAIFAITTDPFIIYTSNIFAILGLRALYFALSAMVHRFRYLKQALALLLVFIGSKIFVADALGIEKVPPVLSLGITFAILGAGVAWSLWKTRNQPGEQPA
jgi:tellurite resistance protein TerC